MESASHAWRVPRENFGILSTHSAPEAFRAAETTRRRLDRLPTLTVGGLSLGEFRRRARLEMDAASQRAMSACGVSVPSVDIDAPLIATGHQPELFHPGVWAKNFAASQIAALGHSPAWNLVVDNDLHAHSGVLVPAGTASKPVLVEVPFDEPHAAAPWEEIGLSSPQRLATFDARLREALEPWKLNPIGCQFERPADGGPIRLLHPLVRARHQAEVSWEVHNRELSLSLLCESDSFRSFAAHLIVEAERFREAHNSVLARYRLRNRIRSSVRPVAPLQEADGRIETPFWVWRQGDRQRGRLFVKWEGRARLQLFRGEERLGETPVPVRDGESSAAELLRTLSNDGWKVRTRALSTTLFARLAMCDLFIHGIGGAKYDEVCDDIMRTFFRVEPPPLMVLTATLLLPIPDVPPASRREIDRWKWTVRDQQWNPERYLAAERRPEAFRLKMAVVECLEKRTDRQRHLDELNSLRAGWRTEIERVESAARDGLQSALDHQAAHRRLTSRDFAWPLHSRERLNELWNRLATHLEKPV